jgi:nitrous oxidase accessory protein NosD
MNRKSLLQAITATMLRSTLVATATIAIVLSVRVCADAVDLQATEQSAQQTVTSILPAGLDPLITDVAVTDDQLLSSGVTLDTVPALLASPTMLIVDDDGVQCPNANFQTINEAVLAAAPGALIRVCPGVYKESVPILKAGLTLQAPQQQGQATQCKTAAAADPTKHAILVYNAALNGGNPSIGFDVEAPGVTIEGFVVQPDPDFVGHDGVGIFTSRFYAGYDIRHNVVQNNSIGIYVNSDGSAPTYVRENCARNNNLEGAAGGTGVYSDQGLSNAEITNNYFTGDESAAIIVDTFLTPPHDIAITHNESVNDGAIVTFASNAGTGIPPAPPASNLQVEYNKVTGSVGSGIVTFAVTNSSYSYNHVENGTFNGISLHSTTNSVVKSNQALGFQLDGIRLGDESDRNTVATNRAENNGAAGLRATEQSAENTIQQNHMKGNAPDCSDNTAGLHTAGTANFWINNFGFTEDRAGICKHAQLQP